MKRILLNFIFVFVSSTLALQASYVETEAPLPSDGMDLSTRTTPSEEWRREMTADFGPATQPQLFAWGPPPTEDEGTGGRVGIPVGWNRRISALFALFASLYIIIIIYRKKNHQKNES